MEAHLYLEARLPMVGSATDFTYKWCVNMGLDSEDASRMALATDEILTDVVLYAFPEETGYIDIWFQYSFSEIEIIIQEKGEPFDPEKYRYSQGRAVQENDFRGASLETVRGMTDTFLFLNRGNDGKEFRLMKRLPSTDIRVTWERNKEAPELSDSDTDEKLDLSQNYFIAPVTSEDAEDIAKLIYRSYNYTYQKEDLYFPKRIETAIHHNYKFGTIVRTESGIPAGYFAVIMSTDSTIGEVGEAVVSPEHRKRGLMNRMMKQLTKMSRQRGLLGLFGEAVTSHVFSQKVNEKFGFCSTALFFSHSVNRKFKGLDVNPSEMLGYVFDFLPLSARWKKPNLLPKAYAVLLGEIYDQFDLPMADTADRLVAADSTDKTNLDLNINYSNRSALIIVRSIGSSFQKSCKRTLRSIESLNLHAIYIDLPIGEPKLDQAINWLKEKKFILAGLMPLFHDDRDYFRMQLMGSDVDFDLIKTHSVMAGKLKEEIMREYYALREKEKST